LIAWWEYVKPGAPFPFVYLVRDNDAASVEAFEGLRRYWERKYPDDELPLFECNAMESEILEAVKDVLANWNAQHPGEPFPGSIIAVSEY
jgi:hypothetical protein